MSAKVLWVYPYAQTFGGSFHSLLDILRYRDRDAFDVLAVLPAAGNVAEEFERLGVRVHTLESAPAGKNLRYLRAVWAFRALLERAQIDLVYFADYAEWRPSGLVAAVLSGVPIVAHVRAVLSDGMAADRWLQSATRIVGNSHAAIQALRGRVGDDKLQVVYGFVDLNDFDPAVATQTRFFPPGTPVVGFVGVFRPEKGVQYFLDMAARLRRKRPDVRFVAVGGESAVHDCGWFDNMQRHAAALGVHDIVHFTGPRRDIAAIMRGLDLLVVPSLTEGFGRVLVEANAVGTPVIASRVGSIPEVIEDGVTGRLVPPGDAPALAAAVQAALADAAWRARVALNAPRLVRERFSPPVQVACLEGVWRAALR